MDIASYNKGQVSGILLRKVDTGEESVLEANGFFYGIGHSPNSQLLEGQVKLDNSGYVIVEADSTRTCVEGVLAAGDVQVILLKLCSFVLLEFFIFLKYTVIRYISLSLFDDYKPVMRATQVVATS